MSEENTPVDPDEVVEPPQGSMPEPSEPPAAHEPEVPAVPEHEVPGAPWVPEPEPEVIEAPWVPEPEVPGVPEPEQPAVPEPEVPAPAAPPPPPPPQAAVAPGAMPPPPPPSAPQPGAYAPPAAPAGASAPKSRTVAGVLGILLGGFGVHKFYLGYTNEGLIMLAGNLLWVVGMGWVPNVIGFVEGIIYLTKSDADFEATYVAQKRPWF